MNDNIPTWYHDAVEIFGWLEERFQETEGWFSPLVISQRLNKPVELVEQCLEAGLEPGEGLFSDAPILERGIKKGRKVYRFNLKWRVRSDMLHAIERGELEQVADDQFRLTDYGRAKVEAGIKAGDPATLDILNRLKDADRRKGGYSNSIQRLD